MRVKMNDILWVMELQGTLLTPLMARNALKSNVTWSSYPFLPPTGASGFLADLVGGMKWYEANDNQVRHLHDLPDYKNVVALGAYPNGGQFSRRHFRTHIGSLSFNYEAYVWKAGRNEGKKLAVIEEYLAEELRFVVVAHDEEALRALHRRVRGRVARIAKKGLVQIEYTAQPCLTEFELTVASGGEEAIAAVPIQELGAFPIEALPYKVPIRSEGTNGGIRWSVQDVIWFQDRLYFKKDTPIYTDKNNERAISASLTAKIFTTVDT